MILRKSFYIRWSAGRSPRVHEVNPGRDPSLDVHQTILIPFILCFSSYTHPWKGKEFSNKFPKHVI